MSYNPTQALYHVGDTLRMVSIVSDTMYCHGARSNFYIPGHPFYPLMGGAIVTEDSIVDLLDHTLVQIDDVHRPRLVYQRSSDNYTIQLEYVRDSSDLAVRQWVVTMILQKAGKYVLSTFDAANFVGELDAPELYAYDFECKSPYNYRLVHPEITHADYLDNYDAELLQILEEVYSGDYQTSRSLESMKSRLRKEAAFAFEVR